MVSPPAVWGKRCTALQSTKRMFCQRATLSIPLLHVNEESIPVRARPTRSYDPCAREISQEYAALPLASGIAV